MARAGEYLLEVRSEEIPARMLPAGLREIATRLFEELMARGLPPAEVETGFTPRRLVVVLRGLQEKEPDREEEVLGPPVRAAFAADGTPTPALHGFAKKHGLPPEAIRRVTTAKGEYLGATLRTVGRGTAEVLGELVPRILVEVSWPKTMRWGTGAVGSCGPWVRPVHGIVSLLDGELVPFSLFGIAAGDATAGHPILSPRPFRVRNAADYRRKLADRGIEVRPEERRRMLWAAMEERAEASGGLLVEDPALLEKLAALCEIPGVLEGSFDESFLTLPGEVLSTSLRDHQSAFTIAGIGGGVESGLLPKFLTVMDRPGDLAGRVRSGNEWVVAARLADARFFHGEDLKVGLGRRAEQLARLAFHEKLGSYADKSRRLEDLAEAICERLGWREEKAAARRAAGLAKADLATEMVKEFTSLQGVMGGLYARGEGDPEAVWQAVYDQYLPASTDDRLPRGRAGLVVALADRVDTLAGIFGLGLVPTGSRDPFGLRRAAQGAVRICLEGGLPLDLEELAQAAVGLYGARVGRPAAAVAADLRPFLLDRVRYLLGLQGYAYDEIEAALGAGRAGDLPDLERRVAALHRVRERPEILSIVLAAKRIANIVKEAEERPVDPSLLSEPAERDLAAAHAGLDAAVAAAAAAGDYERGLAAIADFAGILDRFFVEVLVMAEDPAVRGNRIALLQSIGKTLGRIARLTEMVVDRAKARTEG